MKIILIGYRGTGKSTIGNRVAKLLGWHFVDTDDLVEAKDGRMISDIFAQDGETYFRRVESEVIKELKDEKDIVIAAGGGAVLDDQNIRNLKHKDGNVILLSARPETILKRTQGTQRSEKQRPALTSLKPLDEIKEMLLRRKHHYESAAHLIVDTDNTSTEEAAEKIVSYVREL